jgi:hypothetical protein
LLAGHTGLFTIYEPADHNKREMEIIDPHNYMSNVIETVIQVNEEDRERMTEKKQKLN